VTGWTAADRDDGRPLLASDLLGRGVSDPAGHPLGRIVDLEIDPTGTDEPPVTAAVVSLGRWGRLLGYERGAQRGPWLRQAFARRVVRRDVRTLPWNRLRLVTPAARSPR